MYVWMYQVNKTPEILLLWLKIPVILYQEKIRGTEREALCSPYFLLFILHRVSNIDVRNAENKISGPLDFKIFWGDMPPDPPNNPP